MWLMKRLFRTSCSATSTNTKNTGLTVSALVEENEEEEERNEEGEREVKQKRTIKSKRTWEQNLEKGQKWNWTQSLQVANACGPSDRRLKV